MIGILGLGISVRTGSLNLLLVSADYSKEDCLEHKKGFPSLRIHNAEVTAHFLDGI